MSKYMQIADATDSCQGLLPIVRLVRKGVFPIVQILVPIVLIIYGVIDLGKAVIASDEKEIKTAQNRLIKRCIYAALIFFITTLVTVVMNIVSTGVGNDKETDTNGWSQCWSDAGK